MRRFLTAILAAGLLTVMAAPAQADGQSARDIQAAVDSYLASSNEDANLVGGVGTAGYDNGFWIRGGDFLLRINLTLQARFEAYGLDNEGVGAVASEPSTTSRPTPQSVWSSWPPTARRSVPATISRKCAGGRSSRTTRSCSRPAAA